MMWLDNCMKLALSLGSADQSRCMKTKTSLIEKVRDCQSHSSIAMSRSDTSLPLTSFIITTKLQQMPQPSPAPPPYSHVSSLDEEGSFAEGGEAKWPQQWSALQPWLGLHARLFLSIFTPALASLLFVVVQVTSSSKTADKQADGFKEQLMDACRASERAASLMVSVPHYFADNFNMATKRSIDDTVHGLATVLMLRWVVARSTNFLAGME